MESYEKKFGEQFPLMLVRGLTDVEIAALIGQCIADGKPYDPKIESNDYY
jgi:hypothetical protein